MFPIGNRQRKRGGDDEQKTWIDQRTPLRRGVGDAGPDGTGDGDAVASQTDDGRLVHVAPVAAGGRPSTRDMLGGAIVEVRRNPVSSQSGIGYECPDIDVVREVCPSILGYSYHVAFDALPDESVEKIRTSRLYAMPVVSGLLARLGAAVTSRKARAKGTPQPAELVVALSSAGAGDAGSAAETTVVRATGPGSYKMTAAIAAATVASVAGKPVAPGCRDLVGHPRLLEPVLAFARDAGIHIETPHDNPTTGPLPAAAHCDTKEKEKR